MGIGLPAAKISGGSAEIYCRSHTKVSLCTLSHYVPTDPNLCVFIGYLKRKKTVTENRVGRPLMVHVP
jgi:hypothetical protein